MAAHSETPELLQQVQALSCFLVHVDYVITETEFGVYNCTKVLKTRDYYHGLLINCYWNESFFFFSIVKYEFFRF